MSQLLLYHINIVDSYVAYVCLLWRALHKRHTYAMQYYKQTKDIETLRRILGHSDISTTTIYITLVNIDVENEMKSFKGFL